MLKPTRVLVQLSISLDLPESLLDLSRCDLLSKRGLLVLLDDAVLLHILDLAVGLVDPVLRQVTREVPPQLAYVENWRKLHLLSQPQPIAAYPSGGHDGVRSDDLHSVLGS